MQYFGSANLEISAILGWLRCKKPLNNTYLSNMTITNKATIIQWNNEKGFGFATANGVKYFVHVSALGRPSRSPRVGDTIVVNTFGKGEKGPRIESGLLDGVPTLENMPRQTHFARPRKQRPVRNFMRVLCVVLALIAGTYTLVGKLGSSSQQPQSTATQTNVNASQYTSKDEVARFICENGYLPPNYVNKNEGIRMYESKTGKRFERWNFNPQRTLGVMIGGDRFSNRDGRLPQGDYREADVDYFETNRGPRRLVYASGCNIYYTSDHYESFVKLKF